MGRWTRRAGAAAAAAALCVTSVVAVPLTQAEAAPTLRYTTVQSGLTIPWDLMWVGSTMLYDQRGGGVWSKRGSASPQRVRMVGQPAPYVNSEGGLLGMVAAPDAASSKLFYLCQTSAANRDVRVLRYRLTSATRAEVVGRPIVTGIPLTSGRHTGCRMRFSAKGVLYIGTGDAAVGTNAQNLNSLGGKVLRVYKDGTIPRTNPYYARGGNARYIWNYGHRNIQGLALRPSSHVLYTAEHGSDRDDEVNRVYRRGNYGWNPVPGYNESVPMTDTRRYPNARRALWDSGRPTVATSGITFLSGSRWETWNNDLAVAQLKGTGIRLLSMNADGSVTGSTILAGSRSYGRIRTVMQGPDGLLYFTTANGDGRDRIVRVTPS